MLDRNGTRANGGRDSAAALVDALVVYLKSSFVYPANNPRVCEALQTLLDRLALASPRGAPIEIVLTREAVHVAGRPIEPDGPLLGWLRERFARARLLGVRIAPQPHADALEALAAGLRQSFPPGSPPMADAWRPGGLGIDPLFVEPGDPPVPNLPTPAPTRPASPTDTHSPPPAVGMGVGVPAAASPFPGGVPSAMPPRADPTPPVARSALEGVLALLSR